MTDLINRQAAIDALDEWESSHSWDAWCYEHKNEAKKFHIDAPTAVIKNLPSAQPALDEWCTDCREYDQERHRCPRWNRVIRTTLDDLQKEQAYMQGYEDARKALPSAQANIIACGDCKYWICHDRRCGFWNHGVKPLDWCSYAERRTDG